MKRIGNKTKYELDANYSKHHGYNNVLYLTNRQVSWLTVSIVLLSCFIFIAGYFFGQRKAIEQLNELIDQKLVVDTVHTQHDVASQEYVPHDSTEPLIIHNKHNVDKKYYAQLIGFGTLRAAERFVDRLQQKNMPVKVVERHSKTAQEKEIIWYQIVTEHFDNKDDLIACVQKIKVEEKLNDIKIVSC